MTSGPSAKARKGSRGPSKSEALLARVVAAGGTLEVSLGDGVNYASLMATANLYKVPKGKHLIWVGQHGKHAIRPRIRLEDLPAWVNAALEPIAVPAGPIDQHPVIAALAQGREHFHEVATGRRPAALRMLHALVAEAERRGHLVSLGAVEQAYRQRTVSQQWIHFTLSVSGHHFYLGVTHQMPDRTSTDVQLRRHDRAKGPVRLQIVNGFEHRSSSWWLDPDDDRVGTALAQVLQEVELRAAAEDEHHQRRVEQEHRRQRRWEKATAPARAAYMEDHRAQALIKQVDRWHLAQRIDAYLGALEHANADYGDDPEVAEWIAWARAYREQIDPLRRLEIPVDHAPDAATLKRFLPPDFDSYSFYRADDGDDV